MSLTYGMGGATAALGVVGLCTSFVMQHGRQAGKQAVTNGKQTCSSRTKEKPSTYVNAPRSNTRHR